uniref:Uncharacterized protein n=1 Tax=Strigamia maritima TaxID=126957 RepID=T1JCE6_STRMM
MIDKKKSKGESVKVCTCSDSRRGEGQQEKRKKGFLSRCNSIVIFYEIVTIRRVVGIGIGGVCRARAWQFDFAIGGKLASMNNEYGRVPSQEKALQASARGTAHRLDDQMALVAHEKGRKGEAGEVVVVGGAGAYAMII